MNVVLTADQNIEFQQNVTELPLAVIVLAASSNRIGDGPRPIPPTRLRVHVGIGWCLASRPGVHGQRAAVMRRVVRDRPKHA